MAITPPGIKISGNKQRAEDLGSRAKKFYNFVANQATLGGVNLSRTQVCNDGSIIQATSYLDKNTGLRTGTVRIIGAGKPIPKKKGTPSKFFLSLKPYEMGASGRTFYQITNGHCFTYLGGSTNKDMTGYFNNPDHYTWTDGDVFQTSASKTAWSEDLFDTLTQSVSYDDAGNPIHWNGGIGWPNWFAGDWTTQKALSGDIIVYKGKKYKVDSMGGPLAYNNTMADVRVIGTWLVCLWSYTNYSIWMVSVFDTTTAVDMPGVNHMLDLYDSVWFRYRYSPLRWELRVNAEPAVELNVHGYSSADFLFPYCWIDKDGAYINLASLVAGRYPDDGKLTPAHIQLPLIQDPDLVGDPTINNWYIGTPIVTQKGQAIQNVLEVKTCAVTKTPISETITKADPGWPDPGVPPYWANGSFTGDKYNGTFTVEWKLDPANTPTEGIWLGCFYQDTPDHPEVGTLKTVYAKYNQDDPDFGAFKYVDTVDLLDNIGFINSWPGNDSRAESLFTQYVANIEHSIKGRWTKTSGTKPHMFPGFYDENGKRLAMGEWYHFTMGDTSVEHHVIFKSSTTNDGLQTIYEPAPGTGEFSWTKWKFNAFHDGTVEFKNLPLMSINDPPVDRFTKSTRKPLGGVDSSVMYWPHYRNAKERIFPVTLDDWGGDIWYPVSIDNYDIDTSAERGDHTIGVRPKVDDVDDYRTHGIYIDDTFYWIPKTWKDPGTTYTKGGETWAWGSNLVAFNRQANGYSFTRKWPISLEDTEFSSGTAIKIGETKYLFAYSHRTPWWTTPPNPTTWIDRENVIGVLDTSTKAVTFIDAVPTPKGITAQLTDSRLSGARIGVGVCSLYT